jgi:hypothetical protein
MTSVFANYKLAGSLLRCNLTAKEWQERDLMRDLRSGKTPKPRLYYDEAPEQIGEKTAAR